MSKLERIEKLELLSSKDLLELFVDSIIKQDKEMIEDLITMKVPLMLKSNNQHNKDVLKRIYAYLIKNNDLYFLEKLSEFNFVLPDEFMFYVITTKKPDILRYFLEKGFDANHSFELEKTSGIEKTPLIEICVQANKRGDEDAKDCIKLLFEFGVDLDYQVNVQKWTALHLAAFMGKPEIVELLLNLGASNDKKDSTGDSAWDLATSNIRNQFPELNPIS
jgi:hypothetical protein